ncbi:hypothetical protein A2631_04385 [Candidatus Daviesbacteria bacterium RIFCSPHIGHO2_01_FULL_44_29]|uniref:Uncharacterized protein n=1 Tax=Candidatus Daviesbacteria bacterium RIFCSPHIGHO2_02_FULL_43_12 TaxID=1797776 RepID=A0A1F5KGL7_9BACT|nr:MAG: hypothetical protein A2631_04385 [Candidatus Daviesbacteria bacterium RIFCSPHIGHO2_01_FULL_44_29]OGE39648.1 MAG: hypothetical protein A3E86_03530 [Candidatus Daviesbacteria bacterium RIFCSPHIGHO2_12_FULL_47_45]OGE39960.1 MAG: hypothetical protein A3D25_04115 [Candidatus Daviesbacteria bacterium RIFCSPHIGHO2_02_FULL_43_12]OGE70358.1 MAG: hypothetical protein A3B55_01455 [Candidatus Daviesbacteria bacterium RIFCSPLOWO2_01_FULL_43_15]
MLDIARQIRFEAAQEIRFDRELPVTTWARPAVFVDLPSLMGLFSQEVPNQPPQAFPDLLVMRLSGYPEQAGHAWLRRDVYRPESLRELSICLNPGHKANDDFRQRYTELATKLDLDTLVANHMLLYGWPYIQRGLRKLEPRHRFAPVNPTRSHQTYEQFMQGIMQKIIRGERPPIIDTRSLTRILLDR